MLIVCRPMFYLSVGLSVRLSLSVWTNSIIIKHIKVVSIDGPLAILAAFIKFAIGPIIISSIILSMLFVENKFFFFFLISQLWSKVTVTSGSFHIKCSMCPHCCWTTHSSRRRHWPMAWSMKCCDSLPHSVTFHKVSIATFLRCGVILSN